MMGFVRGRLRSRFGMGRSDSGSVSIFHGGVLAYLVVCRCSCSGSLFSSSPLLFLLFFIYFIFFILQPTRLLACAGSSQGEIRAIHLLASELRVCQAEVKSAGQTESKEKGETSRSSSRNRKSSDRTGFFIGGGTLF